MSASIVLGTAGFGSRVLDADVPKMLECALTVGVTMVDCANSYGEGKAETLVGKGLRAIGRDMQVTSKVGLLPLFGRSEGLAPERILKACDESLQRLERDSIDLYYFHVPDRRVPITESLSAMKELVDAKRVKAYGFSNYSAWEILEAIHHADRLKMPQPTAAQQIYSLLLRELDIEYFRFARAYGITTSVFSTLAGGLLGRAHDPKVIPKGSRFDGNKRYERRFWTPAFFARRDALRLLAEKEGLSLSSFAHAWTFSRYGVDRVIVGATTTDELREAAQAKQRSLSKETMKAIDTLHEEWMGTDTHYARS